MITGAHVLLYTSDPDADRTFFRDVLGFPSVDAGRGWLIFALPPAELAVHPGAAKHELYLMCHDIAATTAELKERGVEFTSEINDQGWGLLTALKLPGGGELGLYEPKHPLPR
jgi:catechol 2,3-dioxygenase-like lactoylglutathione lyase family enzyme